MNLEVETDEEGLEFCESIAREMVRVFDIPLDEAIGRINREWSGSRRIVGKSVVYHETDTYWANTIYFGRDSMWWLDPPDLQPQRYP